MITAIEKRVDFNCRMVELQSREEWLAARKSGVGASETACLFGVGYSSQSPVSLWQEKLSGEVQQLDAGLAKRLRIGKQMEPVLRQIFEDETGMPVHDMGEFTICRHPTIDWMFATLDGVCWNPELEEWCVVELKNIHHFNRDEWKDDVPPLKYAVQVQHQLACTGCKTGYLLGLVGGQEPVVMTIERNDAFIESMIPMIQRFWKHVETVTMPPVDASEATKQALSRLYREDDGEEILLPPEFDDIDAKLVETKERIKDLEEVQKLCENQIRAALGNATSGVLQNGGRYSWKLQERKAYVVKASSSRVLRRHK